MATGKKQQKKSIETLVHDEATRKNIPTAEYQSVMYKEDQAPKKVSYSRGNNELNYEKESRNSDLDPQLVWRGKDQQDWSDLVVNAPPLYIQEKVHPKVLIDDLLNRTEIDEKASEQQPDLFADFNDLVDETSKTDFYQHDAHWTNRMILGDSLQVMASLAEREGLQSKVQCIFFDPPYGIKFNSNFQWSTTTNKATDGNIKHITREPEQVKAFRDTWNDGIHSYMTYLRDRLTVARDLLSASGSIFVQIGDENVHRIRVLLDEIFGEENFVQQIPFRKKLMPLGSSTLEGMNDYIVFYAKNKKSIKYRALYKDAIPKAESRWSGYEHEVGVRGSISPKELAVLENKERVYRLVSQRAPSFSETTVYDYNFKGTSFQAPKGGSWVTTKDKMVRLGMANRLEVEGKSLSYVYFFGDFPYQKLNNFWDDTAPAQDKKYVVQTNEEVVQRCILMTTDPGDLVIDPTCGSGTTAYVAEKWGRRWITVDTSRVSLALARARIMGARYPHYLLADSDAGIKKEDEITGSETSLRVSTNNLRYGFVYRRAPRINLRVIANNSEINEIWEMYSKTLEKLRHNLNDQVKQNWQEWEIPYREDDDWADPVKKTHADWWECRIACQNDIDASIKGKADSEFLYDKPYEDKKKVRVAGPFTVESISPHRMLDVDENDNLIDPNATSDDESHHGKVHDFALMILENLKTAGVQQAHKEDKISFTTITPWPGKLICGKGLYFEGSEQAGIEKRAAIFIGPEFGTVSRPDLVAAAREAGDADFDVLITCAFNYDAHSTEFDKLGRVPVLKARMNADLHMADDLKNTGKGNLFVVFGEPDIDLIDTADGKVRIKVNGVDVFHPNTGEIRSDGADGIACWFIDTDYNEESFFVRHAYFLGANDPYKALKTTLKAEIHQEAWETLHSDTSRPFTKPASGRIAVKVINHLGDEVMKVFKI